MNEIKCPKCGTVFQISETNYESIVKQIRDVEFEKELAIRDLQYKREKESAIKLAEANLANSLKESLNKKDLEIVELKNELKSKEELIQSKLEKQFNG